MAKADMDNPIGMSPDTVGLKLGLTSGIVRKMIYSGELKAFKVGKRWIVPVKSVEAWIDEKLREAAGQ